MQPQLHHRVRLWTRSCSGALTILLSVSSALPQHTHAADLHVPAQFSTIEAAINAANHGDTIVVADGVYSGPGNHSLTFGGKAITLQSNPNGGGPATCVIDVQGSVLEPRRAFHFQSGETSATIVEGFTIKNGYMSQGGAMLCENASPVIRDCIFSQNVAAPTADWQGGGAVKIVNSSAAFINCRFQSNQAQVDADGVGSGGGAMWSENSSPSLTDCDFQFNSLIASGIGNSRSGGALAAIAGGHLNLNNCSFLYNTSAHSAAGMVVRQGNGKTAADATLIDCRFEGNSAYQAAGYLGLDGSTTLMTNCEFHENVAAQCCGAATFVFGSLATITGCTFTANQAQTDGGGAIVAQWNADIQVRDCNFSVNSAVGGGGLWIGDFATADVRGCTIESNTASSGGGVSLIRSSYSVFTNCLFHSNHANFGGGLFANNDAVGSVINCTLANNSASTNGGGIRLGGNVAATINLGNSILWGNSPQQISINGVIGVANVNFSLVQGGWAGFGNISANPNFIASASGDFRLHCSSPGTNAGNNNVIPAGVTTDLDGNPRVYDKIVDLGAFEIQVAQRAGDITCDGIVNVNDLLAVINAWGPCPAPPQLCPADVSPPPNGDGVVNVNDLLMVINNWG